MRGWIVLPLALLGVGWVAVPGPTSAVPSAEHAAGFSGITVADVETHLVAVASAPLEGRDSPSVGLDRAGDYIISVFEEAGLTGAGQDGAFRIPWNRDMPEPDAAGCRLVLGTGGEAETLTLGTDFTPLAGCEGKASGSPVFVGFGIQAKKERYDDLKGVDLKGRVAVILEGEPRHRRRFEGPIVTPDADIYVKLKNLVAEGVAGVLVVRRPPEDAPEDMEPAGIGFRHTWASWLPSAGQRDPRVSRSHRVPVLEVTAEAASRILGQDVLALAAKIDKSVKPHSGEPLEVTVELAAATRQRSVPIDNIVGLLRGSDPDLTDEYVLVGAHYDHVGVDVRGQVGFGADDNGSGTTAMLEIAQAMAAAGPRRSVLFAAFSGEEDGLLGSRAMAQNPPVPRRDIVAMINLDMVGRGDKGEVVVLGTDENPDLERVLTRARKLKNPKVKVITGKARHLWQRSDHHSFHTVGVPVLFFFEAVSETDNPDYHTWRDTIDKVDFEKVARTARMAYNTAWILAEDEERPSPPRD